MINNLYPKIELQIENNYWTNFLGISRSIIALSTLLTLLLNSKQTLFYLGINNETKLNCTGANDFSIFCLIGNIDTAITISVLVLFFVIVGLYPKFTCVFHWWITYSFATSSYAVDGGDQIASIITLLIIPICIFDKRKWHWKKDSYLHCFYEKVVAFFAYLLISIQVFIIYFHAAVGKFFVTEWIDGTAIYYWFYNSFFGMNDYLIPIMKPLLKSPILITLLTWSILVFELALAFGVFYKNKKTKVIFCIAGIFFHFLIMLFHGLVSFFLIMTGTLILFFIAKNYNFKIKKYVE